MRVTCRGAILTLLVGFTSACQRNEHFLTDAAIADTAKVLVQGVFAKSNRLDFSGALDSYSADPNTRYVKNGVLIPSLEVMRSEYEHLAPTLDSLASTIDSLRVLVLAADAAAVTASVHFRIKAKGRPAFEVKSVWSGLIQRRHGAWQIVQSHESWVNAQDVLAAIAPPTISSTDEMKARKP